MKWRRQEKGPGPTTRIARFGLAGFSSSSSVSSLAEN